MKGFLAGVLLTVICGGFFFHLESRYETLSACKAATDGLTRAVQSSITADLKRTLGPDVPDRVTDVMMPSLADPLIRKRVEQYLANDSWFDCAAKIVRLDLLGGAELVREVRSVTLRL